MNEKDKLWQLCELFIITQRIRDAETVFMSDRVIENAYSFLRQMCDIVGYWEDPYEEEDERDET